MQIIPIVLCGGSGSRLWPASREEYPKQFLNLFGERPLFQSAVMRVAGEGFQKPIVITSVLYRFLVAEQLRLVGVDADILLEPVARDSCAAIAAATAHALQRDPAATVLVIAADHAIADEAAFLADVALGSRIAEKGELVCFGLTPTFPSTGYGYIKPCKGGSEDRVHRIDQFVEKPTEPVAAQYISDGYLWNSGNFVFRADTFLEQLEIYSPKVKTAAVSALEAASRDLDFILLNAGAFGASPSISVDYALMEHTQVKSVVVSDFAWSDIGSWSSIKDQLPSDENGNSHIGDGAFFDSRNSMIHSPGRLTVVGGVDDVIVISTDDATLVISSAYAEKVKHIVNKLTHSNRVETRENLTTHRPWGNYQRIDDGGRYQVKRIIVNPGGKLSLQSHMHRSEHWVVVRGTAYVTIDERSFILTENQSTYIPLGSRHRLENPGKISLELIEIQTGSYLAEDDIVRYDDVYRRT